MIQQLPACGIAAESQGTRELGKKYPSPNPSVLPLSEAISSFPVLQLFPAQLCGSSGRLPSLPRPEQAQHQDPPSQIPAGGVQDSSPALMWGRGTGTSRHPGETWKIREPQLCIPGKHVCKCPRAIPTIPGEIPVPAWSRLRNPGAAAPPGKEPGYPRSRPHSQRSQKSPSAPTSLLRPGALPQFQLPAPSPPPEAACSLLFRLNQDPCARLPLLRRIPN